MKYLYYILLAFYCVSCGQGNKQKNITDISISENKDNTVNVINQAKPKLMIIPSDRMLKDEKCLTINTFNGKKTIIRDISGFIVKSEKSNSIISAIQKYFIQIGYPLNDLEQSLKAINNRQILDEADNIVKDAKTLLLNTVSPDIILELDYQENVITGRTSRKSYINIALSAIDVYSDKVIAVANKNNLDMSLDEYLEKGITKDLETLEPQLRNYFTDIVTNGREISFRVTLSNDCPISLSDMYNNEGDTYSDWIRRWVITNAKNGSANMVSNTKKEMAFTNVRISNVMDDGTQFNAYEFAGKFRKEFFKTFSLQSSNNSQGLGNALVIIN
ncbi:DUF6175 family protein [uncultured Bacteroides sp.]|uniref:DUF6175 family protein n=1 Tax=uncultured Bacteroides sp. TaxID=162156 RepID=UPI0025FA05C7|nr:DUF6175 family protein [uncultured Bacteroides sp.]